MPISSHESNIAIVQHRREINRGMCDLRFDIEDTCLCKAPTKVVLSSECPSGYPNPTPQCTELDVVIQGFVFHKGSYYTLPEWPNPFGTVYDVPCNITAGEALRRIRSDIYSDFRQNKLKGHCEVACRKKMPEWLDKFSGPDDASQFDEHHPEPNWGGLGAGTYTCAPDCRNYGTAPRGSNRPSAYCADLK